MGQVRARFGGLVFAVCLLVLAALPVRVLAGNEVSALRRALGAAFKAKAELALLKGQLGLGKVYLAAAHEADGGMCELQIKALDMMYLDFPYVAGMLPDFRGGVCGFSGDERYAVYCHGLDVVRQDLGTGVTKKVTMEDGRYFMRMAVSENGRYVSLSGNVGNMIVCDMEEEKVVGSYSFKKGVPRGLETVRMGFSPDEGTLAAYYSMSDRAGVHFLKTADLSVERVGATEGSIKQVRYLDGRSLLLVKMGGDVVIADAQTLAVRKKLAKTGGWCADYLAEQDRVAVGLNGCIRVYDTRTAEQVAEYKAASHNITPLRYVGGGRYLAYGSPKGESGVIDCATGKAVQVFDVGREAAICTGRHLLASQGKVIDLSACRGYEGAFEAVGRRAAVRRSAGVPDSVLKACAATVDKAKSKAATGVFTGVFAASDSEKTGAFATSDGRTFVYDFKQAGEVESVTADLTRIRTEVTMVVTDYYRRCVDMMFFGGDKYLLRLCETGNGMGGGVEVYCLADGKRSSLRMDDPPVVAAVIEEGRKAILLDERNRVLAVSLPHLVHHTELLGQTAANRAICVDKQSNMLVVKTGSEIAAYDLGRIADGADIRSCAAAADIYGVSFEEREPLWSLAER